MGEVQKYKSIVKIKRRERERKRRKQRIIRCAIAILILIVSLFLYGGIIPKHNAVAYGYETCSQLWDIAERHCPDTMDKWDYIEEVRKLNGMSDYKVYSGRIYQYPIYEQ